MLSSVCGRRGCSTGLHVPRDPVGRDGPLVDPGRPGLPRRRAECVVVEAVEVTDHLGDPVLVTAVRIPGLSLLLSGATWGYAGTGPNGLAAILQDLGAFGDHETAIGWVSQLPIDRAWRLEIRAEPA